MYPVFLKNWDWDWDWMNEIPISKIDSISLHAQYNLAQFISLIYIASGYEFKIQLLRHHFVKSFVKIAQTPTRNNKDKLSAKIDSLFQLKYLKSYA